MQSFNLSPSARRYIERGKRSLATAYALPLPVRLAIASACVGAATLLRFAIAPSVGDRLPYAPFYPAVEVAALLGGLAPGLFATFSSALVELTFFATLTSVGGELALGIFLVSCAMMSLITEVLHLTRQRLSQAHAARKAAESVYIANRHFQLAVSAGAIGAWERDVASNIVAVNDTFREIYGFAREEIITPKTIYQHVLPEDAEAAWASHLASLDPAGDGLYRAEYRICRPSDKAIRWISVRGQTLFDKGKATRVVGVSRDITDERAVSRALLERAQISEQLASIALATPGVIGTFFLNADGRIAYRYVSPKAKDVFGAEAGEICADAGTIFRRLNRDDLEEVNNGLFRSAREMSMCVVEFRFDHPDKGPIWIEAQASPVRETDGQIVWHGYASDVTARKRAEHSLAESAARLQATIDGCQDAVLTLDWEGSIQSINESGAAMFGYEEAEYSGLTLDSLLVSDEAETNAPVSVATRYLGQRLELRGKRKSGRMFPAEITLSEATCGNRVLFVCFVKDLTRQHKIEAQMEKMHRDRLAALGGMAATVAHEINQPLSATATYINVVQRRLGKMQSADAGLIDILDKAADQTRRAGRIVTSLRDLAQRGEPDKTLLCVHDLIREYVDAEGTHTQVQIRLDCQARSDQVVGDRAHLRQVIANLVRNAVEAMQASERRELVVSTCNPDERAIRVDVLDTGCGLIDLAGDDCFEPFTTTKTKGMGIGLSISRSIIEAHYGRIWGRQNNGGGAVFSFTLPLQESDVDL